MNWVEIYSTYPFEAEIIKSKLESEGIPCILKKEAVSSIYGIHVNGLGKVKILVPDEFADEAVNLLEFEI